MSTTLKLRTNPEVSVGVLDIDLCGPSQPRMMGCEGEGVHQSGSGWSPIYVEDNLSVMSAGFLLPSPGQVMPVHAGSSSGPSRLCRHLARPQEERSDQAAAEGC